MEYQVSGVNRGQYDENLVLIWLANMTCYGSFSLASLTISSSREDDRKQREVGQAGLWSFRRGFNFTFLHFSEKSANYAIFRG